MPIPPDMVRCRLLFQLGTTGPVDQAVFGFHMQRLHSGGNAVDWPANVQEISDKIADKWVANVTQKVQFSNDISLSATQAYHLDAATGLTLDKGQTAATGARAWRGTATSGSAPFAVATAVSLYGYTPGTFTQNARDKRGRFYLPPFRCDSMGTGLKAGLYDSALLASVRTGIYAFLEDIHGMSVGGVGGGLQTDAMSLSILSKSKGTAYPVIAARIGERPDQQRRRENKLPESYDTHLLTQP